MAKQVKINKPGHKQQDKPSSQQQEKPDEKKIISIRETLSDMILTEPAMTGKLCEAIESGRYFITVTFLKKYRPEDKSDLHHFFCRKGIEPNDCIGSIRHIKNDFIAREMPDMALDADEGWH